MREFEISETFIKKFNRFFLIFFCFVVVFLVVFAFINLNFRINARFFAAIGKTLLIQGIILLVITFENNRGLRKLKVFVYEDKLVRQSDKKQQILMWDDITRLKTIGKKSGSIDSVRLYIKESKKIIVLRGFEEMDDLAHLIKERISGKAVLQEKHLKLDFETFVVLMFIPIMVFLMIGMSIIFSMGRKAVGVLAISTVFFCGLLLLILRPFTNSDLTNRWVELILGAILLILGFYGLIVFLLTGKLL